jgi:hypothetical protein
VFGSRDGSDAVSRNLIERLCRRIEAIEALQCASYRIVDERDHAAAELARRELGPDGLLILVRHFGDEP